MKCFSLCLFSLLSAVYSYTEFSNTNIRVDFIRCNLEIPNNDLHEIIFVVKQLNLDKLERMLMDISDPFSTHYGNFHDRQYIAALTTNAVAIKYIRLFLQQHNISAVNESLYGEFITASAPIIVWETIFSTRFSAYQHVENNNLPVVYRAPHYTVHDELMNHIDGIFNIIELPLPFSQISPKKTFPETSLGELASSTITLSKFNDYYNVFSNTGSTSIKQTVYSTSGQYWSSTDLASFQSTYGIPSHPIDADPNSRNSHSQCVSNANNCGESNLDIEYITAIAQNTYTSIIYDYSSDAFVTWITSVANSASPAHVYSISYGVAESYLSSTIVTSFNTQAIKLGAMGVTVVVASGDDGAPGYRARSSSSSCSYDASFPASSPYVVAVGATMGPEAGTTEVACDANLGGQITTGGGFSKFATRLSHQDRALKAYFATVSTSAVSGYSTSGRGFPDVSLAGKYYETIVGGVTFLMSGTSASAPAFAAMVSLVNAARLKIGKSTVGFLNPALYAYNGSFANDITSGNNKCTENVCCTQGFYTSKGWDPVTGFGSVDFTKFYNLFTTTSAPTKAPVYSLPTNRPTLRPTAPTLQPNNYPTHRPTQFPSFSPTSRSPTVDPTLFPTSSPTTTSAPTTQSPTQSPTTKAATIWSHFNWVKSNVNIVVVVVVVGCFGICCSCVILSLYCRKRERPHGSDNEGGTPQILVV